MAKILRYAGFAADDALPTTPAPADWHVDIASATLDSPSDAHLEYEGGFGRGRRVHRPGFYAPSGNVVYATDVKTILSVLRWTLGGYAFTADSPHNLHELWGDEDRELPTFTTRLGKDLFEHVFVGCVVNSLQLEVSDAFAQITLDLVSAKDYKATLLGLSALLLPEEYPLSFPDVQFFVGGVERSAATRNLSLTIANNASAEQGRGVGSRYPNRIPGESRAVDMSLGLRFEDTTDLERFWGSATGVSDGGSDETDLRILMSAGDDGTVDIELPRALYTDVGIQGSGRSEIEQSISVQAFTGPVTLEDGTTEVETDLYVRVSNDQPDQDPA